MVTRHGKIEANESRARPGSWWSAGTYRRLMGRGRAKVLLLWALLSAPTEATIPIDDADVQVSLASCATHIEEQQKHLFRVGAGGVPIESDEFCSEEQCCYSYIYELRGGTLPCAPLFQSASGSAVPAKHNAPGFAYDGKASQETRLAGYQREVFSYQELREILALYVEGAFYSPALLQVR